MRFVAVRIVLMTLDRLYPGPLKATVSVTLARNAEMACELADIKDRVILLHGFSEYPVARLLERIVEDDWVCVDAGANSGEYTLLLSARAARGEVYAFEAAPPVFRTLASNVEGNQLSHAVVENLALNSFDGSCTFYVDLSPENTGLSSLSFPVEAGGDAIFRAQTVQCVSLDTYFASLSRLDLMKIDVQSHEIDVLHGGAQTLSRLSPALIFEFGSLDRLPDKTVIDFLRDLGYAIFCIDTTWIGALAWSNATFRRGKF